MEKSKLFFLILAVVIVYGSCSSGNRKVAVSPPTLKVPPPSSNPVHPVATVPVRAGKHIVTDPVAALITKVDGAYGEGVKQYQAGNLQQAKLDFDKALSMLLESGMDVQHNAQLKAEFTKLVDDTYGLEASGSANGGALGQHDYAPPPIESFADLTFPVDPRVRQRAEQELASVRSDMPLVTNDYVASFLTYFQNRGQGYIDTVLRRVGKYGPMISSVLQKYGLPQDLIYLAAAESAFNPHAVSKEGAAGIWQFMPSRAREYGLKLNRYVDQREDPVKSTEAAARHLRDLYKEFGDWYLAMAAYDSGPMTVQRAIERTGYANFWKLRQMHVLPLETQNYVPIFIATALIAKDPEAYGFDVQPDQPLDPDRVTVTSPTDLRLVAELIDRPVKELEMLNPSLLSWATPMNEKKFVINLPRGTKNLFEQRIAEVPPSKRVWWRALKVKRGETLTAIARKYRITRVALLDANHLSPGENPEVGEHLIIPLPRGRQPFYRRGLYYRYRIRRGDTLGAIAERFHVSVTSLRRWNHLRSTVIVAGRTLQVFGRVATWHEHSSSYRTADRNGHRVYRIERGDTLGGIAAHFHVSVAELRLWNHLRSNTIVVGRDLRVSGSHHERAKLASDHPLRIPHHPVGYYRVRRGDTLGGIASRFHVSVAELRLWNHLRNNTIVVGRELRVSNRSHERPTVASNRPLKRPHHSVYHYRIRRGDNLSVIADRFNVSVSQIRHWNHLDGSVIVPGQVLDLYGVSD